MASYRLGTKSLWLDEAVSANHARLGLGGLWTVITSHDPNMGLYYVLLHFWTRVFGYSEAAVRSMTVVLAGFAVPVMYLLGRRLFGRSAGIVAALLLAVAPFFVQYEQTARSYALVVLLVLLSSYFFVAELEKPSRATLVAYVLASVLAVYAHYFAAFVLVVQALTLIAVRRRGAVTAAWLSAAGVDRGAVHPGSAVRPPRRHARTSPGFTRPASARWFICRRISPAAGCWLWCSWCWPATGSRGRSPNARAGRPGSLRRG